MPAFPDTLRIRPEDALQDYRPWHRLLVINLGIFLGMLFLASLAWFILGEIVQTPDHLPIYRFLVSRALIFLLYGQIIALLTFNWPLVKGVLAGFFYKPTSPYNLALMRFVVMGNIGGHVLVYVPQNLGQVAALPHEARVPLTGIDWLVDILPISPGLYQAVTILGGIACLAAAFGLFTRYSLLLSALLLFYILGVPNFFGKLNHTHFMMWFPAFLAFSPAGEVWSLDALFRRRQPLQLETRPHYRYGLAMKLVFFQLGILYFFSGMGKIWQGNLGWALSDNLVNLMRLEWMENYGDVPFFRLDQYPVLASIMGIGVILFEFSYLFLILTPKTRIFGALSGIGFHYGTGIFLHINFKFLQLLTLFHFDYHRLLGKLNQTRPWWQALLATIAGSIAMMFVNLNMGVALLIAGTIFILAKQQHRSKQKQSALLSVDRPIPKSSSWLLYIGIGLLSVNFLCGFAQIHSWPFSAYPAYSFVRPDHVTYIWFRPSTSEGISLDLNELSKAARYKKENILGMSEGVAYAWDEGKQAAFELKLRNYWLRYREKVPALKAATQTTVLYQILSLDPDSIHLPRVERPLGTLKQEAGQWVWEPGF